MKIENVLLGIVGSAVVALLTSVVVGSIMYTEYQKNPDYDKSEIFAQGRMQKSTDCYGITTVKIGGRVVDDIVSIPSSGYFVNVKLSDLCPDQDFTVYRKNFWLVGNATTIK